MKVLSIGRDDDCNITLSDTMISRRHAILKIYATGKMEIVDMGQNGTYVNGIKLSSNVPYPVSRKDVISFAHKRQLDWSKVPDNFKIYRYIALGILTAACLIGAVFLVRHFAATPGTPAPVPMENPPVEVVTPPAPAENPKEEEEEKEKEVKPKEKAKKGGSKYFFPPKKEKKEEEQKEKEKKEAEEPPRETMPVL